MSRLSEYFNKSKIGYQYKTIPKNVTMLTDEEAVEFAVNKIGYDRERCYCKCCGKIIKEEGVQFFINSAGTLCCSRLYFLRVGSVEKIINVLKDIDKMPDDVIIN